MAFFQGLPEHAPVEGQFGYQDLESAVLGFEFRYAKLFIRYGIVLEGFPAVVGGRCVANLTAGLVDAQAGIEVSLNLAEDRGDALPSW